MKKIILLLTLRPAQCITLCFLLLTLVVNAQTPPNAFNYSAVARNAAGQPIATTTIGIQVTILKTSPTGASQYSENHFVNTDAYGLFNLVIGAGAVQSGSMATIDWSNDNYFLKVGMDAAGSTNFLTMGTTQLLSVPYALYAKSAGTVSGGVNETDPVFSASVAVGISAADTTNWNNKQNQLTAGSNITITGNTISATTSGGGGFTHFIGEEFGGGVIFHLWKDSQGVEHGLIIDLVDLSVAYPWSNITTIIGSSAQSTWNGIMNSNSIIAQPGHSISAAYICLNSTNGGHSDWYLPSNQEFSMLGTNYYTVAKSLSQISGATPLGDASNTNYWTSTESISNEAGIYGTANNSLSYYWDKSYSFYVRAIRAF
jgi:hypothetical protein